MSTVGVALSEIEYLNAVRLMEVEQLLPLLPQHARLLDFGAGTGQQAKFLAGRGFEVVAIDLPASTYAAHRLFPVIDYDGRHIPLADGSIDVIFSSNVLEHVEDLPGIMAEFRRVLKPSGTGIHIMPTPSWRLWTFAAGVGDAAKAAMLLPGEIVRAQVGDRRGAFRQGMRRIARGIVPRGHGTSVEGISELWTFSARHWRRVFERNGFEVMSDRPMQMFYTGNVLFGDKLPWSQRRKLSSVLGSATRMYVVRPAQT